MEWSASRAFGPVIYLFFATVRTQPAQRDPTKIEKLRDEAHEALTILDAHLADRPYVCGDDFTMGDIPLGCVAYRYFNVEVDHPALPHVEAWYQRLAARPAYDPEQARALLAEAGYPDGFSFGLKCPNDRYLNDEAVCQAVTGMLAQVGLEAKLDAMPVQNYWPELRADNYDMYLLGWSPGTFDAEHPIRFLAATPNEEAKLGSWNFGGFSNARVDELLPQIQSEIDDGQRQAMLDEVTGILQEEVAYVPLYVQPLVWGAKENIELTQRPDNFFILRWVRVE